MWNFIKSRFGKFIEFFSIQVGAQIVGVATGLWLVRSLSKHDYTIFTLANSFQLSCSYLADLGISIALRKIGGGVWHDPFRMGQVVQGALQLRRRYALGSMLICTPFAIWMLSQNNASLREIIPICILINLAIFPLLSSSVFTVAFQLLGQTRKLSCLDLIQNIARLVLQGLASLKGWSAVLVVTPVVGSTYIQWFVARKWYRSLNLATPSPLPSDIQEMNRCSLQAAPNTLFYCLQGQVLFLILTLTGKSNDIANFGAIGRIATVFSLFSIIVVNLVGPKFSRIQQPREILRSYMAINLLALIVLGVLVALVMMFPGLFLWILGEKYQNLRHEFFWLIGTACCGQYVALVSCLNLAKGWMRWNAMGWIPLTVLIQLLLAMRLDLHATDQILLFNLCTVLAPLPLLLMDGWGGLSTGFRVAVCAGKH